MVATREDAPMGDDELLTVQDIVRTLKVHEESVRKWIRTGALPAFLLGSSKGGYRVRRDDFERFVRERFGGEMGKAAA
jgi:excisionase family DNA binding protein